ncbi:MAG: pyridoxal phosphate-dependent aminotransferase, partial [Sedimentibacter sp.]|uniref:pyridoxal phosphate-dependent aminotransferase n=1 Tax=Sedimentibacter sp. TaxID=1960295 RepID=UPI002981E39D
GYMSNSGYEDVREAIAQDINKKYNVNLTYKNVAMTVGAGGGLSVVFKTILDPDDEVITFSPYFGPYRAYVGDCNAKLVVVPTHLGIFQPDLDALEASITSKTKAILLNNPNNPTGAVYGEEVLKGIAEIATRKSKELNRTIYIISDDPYREIVYDDIEVPFMLNYYTNTFIVYSYSKSLSLPGERIGYVAFLPEMEEAEEVEICLSNATRNLGFTNAPSLFQRVLIKCLDETVDVDFYRRNRDLLYNHLLELGFECTKPQGAFYLFPKALEEDDKAFVAAAKKYNILIVPGTTFGCPGYFRASYCISYEKIEKSLEAWTKLANEYKTNEKRI